MRLLFIACLGGVLGAVFQPSPAAKPIETPHVIVSTSTGGSGAKTALYVDITPKPTMHVYAPGEKDGIPVALTIESVEGVKPAAPAFPAAQKYYFEPLKLTQLVYSKPFRITQPVAITTRTSAPITIKGTLRYQACDDTVCYLPKSVPLTWVVGK
jgi:DsbC/DsbD-like thiol-disulfide interchange protein